MKSFKPLLPILLASPFTSAYRWFNWQFQITCQATGFYAPQDEAELVDWVKDRYEDESMIKVVGNGHAFGNLTTCVDQASTNRSSYVVSLTNLQKLEVHDDNTVTFGAGWDIADLVPALKKKSLSLENLGTERIQNFVGAFVTGTHGSGRELGNIASQVIGFRVVDASGGITVVNQTHNEDLLPAFRISLGALGIITEVTLQAKPLSYLKRTMSVFETSYNLTDTYQRMYELYEEHDHMSFWGPHMTWDDTNGNWTLSPTIAMSWWEETNVTDVSNCTDYCSNNCGDCSREFICYAESSDALSTPEGGVCNRHFYAEIEHFVPVEHFVDAAAEYTAQNLAEWPELQGWNNQEMVYEIRFSKGDDSWMSQANTYNLSSEYSGVFAIIELDWYATYNNYDALWQYQELAQRYLPNIGQKYNARPHWGKMSWFNSTYAETIFPKLQDFLDVQEKMDPKCQFVNEFLISHLGIERCEYAITGVADSIADLK